MVIEFCFECRYSNFVVKTFSIDSMVRSLFMAFQLIYERTICCTRQSYHYYIKRAGLTTFLWHEKALRPVFDIPLTSMMGLFLLQHFHNALLMDSYEVSKACHFEWNEKSCFFSHIDNIKISPFGRNGILYVLLFFTRLSLLISIPEHVPLTARYQGKSRVHFP